MDNLLELAIQKTAIDDLYYITDGFEIIDVTFDKEYAEFKCSQLKVKENLNLCMFGHLKIISRYMRRNNIDIGIKQAEANKEIKDEETPKLCERSVQQAEESN